MSNAATDTDAGEAGRRARALARGLAAFLSAPGALLIRHRTLLRQTVLNDIRARYAGSVLGLAWLVLYPLLFLGTYALIYICVFKVRFALFDSNQYVVLIFCGLIPFLGFAEALGAGVGSVTSNASLIKNTLFPIDLIPVKVVLVSQCTQLVGTGLLLAAVAITGRLTWWATLLPLVWVAQLMMSMGLIWILSGLNVYLRDLQNMVSVAVLLLMMLSPIAYTADMVPADLQPYLRLNPLFYLIVCYQDCLMLGQFPREGLFWGLAAISVVLFCVGYWFFSRLKTTFADNV
jgi:lipopolysaccharide transport system permease protein